MHLLLWGKHLHPIQENVDPAKYEYEDFGVWAGCVLGSLVSLDWVGKLNYVHVINKLQDHIVGCQNDDALVIQFAPKDDLWLEENAVVGMLRENILSVPISEVDIELPVVIRLGLRFRREWLWRS